MQRLMTVIAAVAAGLAAGGGAAAAQPLTASERAHIAAIENGLIPPIVIKGRPARPRRIHAAETAASARGPQRAAGSIMPDLGYEAAIARLDQAVLATDVGGGSVAAGGRMAAGGRTAAKPAARPRPGGKRKK